MTIFQMVALIITATALGGYINHKFVRLPATIGHMAFALLFSVVLILAGGAGLIEISPIANFVNQIDFSDVVLHGMLSFLLFAAALHIDLSQLKDVKWAVLILASIGVIMATFITGTIIWYAAQWVGLELPYIYALMFGALIAPTDPIAVMGMLKNASGIPQNTYAKMGGESLFNDGVAIVLFVTILDMATNGGAFDTTKIMTHFLFEAVGGIALGAFLGWVAYRLIRSIDDYKVEILLTLALVTGGYALAEFIHVSAPLCMVVAGLIIGNQGRSLGMSDTTRKNTDVFWELIDEILNAVLFLLIGLHLMIVPLSAQAITLGLIAMIVVLFARYVSVGLPITLIRVFEKVERGTVRLLVWGGLRGGISIAMALSIPNGPEKNIILTLTYTVVLFSIFLQGLTFEKGIKMLFGEKR